MHTEDFDNCGSCIHLNDSICTLRRVKINSPRLTTCKNWSYKVRVPPVYEIDGVVLSKIDIGGLTRLPWFQNRETRIESYDPNGKLVLKVSDDQGEEFLTFDGLQDYVISWAKDYFSSS